MKILIYNILICHFDKYSNPNAINSIVTIQRKGMAGYQASNKA